MYRRSLPLRPFSRRAALLAVGAVASVSLSGCMSADAPVSSVATSASEQGAQSADASPTTEASEDSGSSGEPAAKKPTSTKDVDVETKGSDEVAVVAGFNAIGQNGVDVFELSFTGPISGYTVRYVDEVTTDPEGKKVKLAGKAALQVVVRNATLDNSFAVAEGTTPTTFDSSALNFEPRMLAIKQVATAGDFEATLSLGIGVAKKLPFKASLLKKPTRLVIEIAQP